MRNDLQVPSPSEFMKHIHTTYLLSSLSLPSEGCLQTKTEVGKDNVICLRNTKGNWDLVRGQTGSAGTKAVSLGG